MQMKKFNRLLIAVLVSVSLTVLLAFNSNNYFEIAKNLDIFAALYKEVNTYYVNDVEPSKMMKKGIDAMLETLDPYTNFITEDEIESYRFQSTGKYGGIGASIRKAGDYVVLAEPYEGFAAYKAGLRAGDMIYEIDGKSIKGKSTDDISKLLKGQPNTEIKLTVKKLGSSTNEIITVKREEIKIKSVPFSGMLNNDIAYVKLSQFTDHCAKDVEDALQSLKEKNTIKGIVLDLRGNPGGLLNEAVNLTNLFVDKGTLVVSTKGKVEEWNKTFNALNNPFDTKIPVIVLVNSGSASASEIVSGALQDLDRGIVLGQRTFGKGLVQTTRSLSYGTQLKVTTAHYYTPSGRCIQAINYAERNEDGSVAKIPDSLKNTFKTSKGRVVSDGGGVEPDVVTESSKPHQIIASLVNKNIIFDFASNYTLQHKEIAPPSQFKLSDKDFDDFLQFIKDKDYDYSTKSEDALKNFEKMAEKESYYSALKTDIDEVRHKMMHDKEQDVIKYKADIMRYLTEEIVSRYYFQSGRVENSLNNDPDILKALELFNDPLKFHKILSPTK